MKKKIAIAILVIASYVGIALFVNSIITKKTTENKQAQERLENQVVKTEKLEENVKDYLKYNITDDCIYYAGEEARSFCQCSADFTVENNSAMRLINIDMGFDEEALNEEVDRAYEKCMYLAI